MDLKDQFKYLVGGYYGVTYMDEYPLKEYVLIDIKNYIENFIKENPIPDFDYKKEAEAYEKELSTITKLQDSLLVLHKINASMDLIIMVKQKIKELQDKK